MYVRHSAHRGGALRAHQKQPGHVNRDRALRRVFSSCPWPPPGTSGGTRVWFEGTYVSNGTVPEGSMWARNPLPRNDHQDTFAGFAPACEEQKFSAGEVVCVQGSISKCLHILLDGQLTVRQQPHRLPTALALPPPSSL